MPFSIYVIQNCTDKKLYVGQTMKFPATLRWDDHIRRLHAGEQKHLYAAMRKHGIEIFAFFVIEEQQDNTSANDAEEFWIDFFRSWDREFGYNRTRGGEGRKLTSDVVEHLSLINSGERNPFFGKHHSPEAKKRISAATRARMKINHPSLGKKESAETIMLKSEAMKKVWSNPEYRKRLSIAQLNRKPRVLKLSLNDQEEVRKLRADGWDLKKIASQFRVSKATISRVLALQVEINDFQSNLCRSTVGV